jgi:hypothetical protein
MSFQGIIGRPNGLWPHEMSCATHRLDGGNGISITVLDAKRDVVARR